MIQRLLQRHGTEQPGPDLDGYLTEQSLAAANCVDPALLERIDAARAGALGFFNDFDVILCPPARALARPNRNVVR